MTLKIYLILCISCINISPIRASGGVYQTIMKNLLTNYDTGVRPVLLPNTTTVVKLHFGIVQLLNVIWVDEHLKWNSKEYVNADIIQYPAKNVWLPDIILINSPDSKKGTLDASTNVIINSDGTVYNDFITVQKAFCDKMDMSRFPFDAHDCYMDFTSWTYAGEQLDIVDDMANYKIPESLRLKENPEWIVTVGKYDKQVAYDCCPNGSYPTLRIPIKLTRKPLYYMLNVLLPITVTCSVCFIGMFSPSSNTGERLDKVTLGITTLLAVSLLMFAVSAQLPVTSNGIPLIGLFLGMYIVTITIGVICTTLIMMADHHGLEGKPLPKWARTVVLRWFGKFLVLRYGSNENDDNKVRPKNAEEEHDEISLIKAKNHPAKLLNLEISILISKIDLLLETLAQEKSTKESRKRIRKEWTLFCTILDRICLITFLAFTLIFTFVLFSK